MSRRDETGAMLVFLVIALAFAGKGAPGRVAPSPAPPSPPKPPDPPSPKPAPGGSVAPSGSGSGNVSPLGHKPPWGVPDLHAFALGAGFTEDQATIAAAIAMAESGGKPDAVGDNGDSIGLWQINLPAHPEYDRAQLTDGAYNAAAAWSVSKGGTDFSPWTMYRNGRYRAFIPQSGEPFVAPEQIH